MNDNTNSGSPLGREVAYPAHYDSSLLYPIPRALGRTALGLDEHRLPFIGHDRWQAFELSWLDLRGKPHIATATLQVPADSPQLIESKSLKLYLNSLNASRFESAEHVGARIQTDLSQAAGAEVQLQFGLAPMTDADPAASIDDLALDITCHGPPDAGLLVAAADDIATEVLCSSLLKSNCPVTGQPDWADVEIRYHGPRIDRASLLRYLVSFRDHAEFHEQCVERIFRDLLVRCAPLQLSVEARYTRRGGLDINPWRATPGSAPPPARRGLRQ